MLIRHTPWARALALCLVLTAPQLARADDCADPPVPVVEDLDAALEARKAKEKAFFIGLTRDLTGDAAFDAATGQVKVGERVFPPVYEGLPASLTLPAKLSAALDQMHADMVKDKPGFKDWNEQGGLFYQVDAVGKPDWLRGKEGNHNSWPHFQDALKDLPEGAWLIVIGHTHPTNEREDHRTGEPIQSQSPLSDPDMALILAPWSPAIAVRTTDHVYMAVSSHETDALMSGKTPAQQQAVKDQFKQDFNDTGKALATRYPDLSMEDLILRAGILTGAEYGIGYYAGKPGGPLEKITPLMVTPAAE